MTTRIGHFAVAALVTAVSAAAAVADMHMESGDGIRAAIIGNTVQGAMSDGSGYREYYAPDGAILSDGYSGEWSIESGEMCFSYGGEASGCFGVSVADDRVTWYEDGAPAGTGTILEGNPNGF